MSDLFDWFDYLSDDDTESSGSVIGTARTSGLSDAELAAQQAKFEDFRSRVKSGDVEDNAGASNLRFIVEADNWFVALKDDGDFELVNVKQGQYKRLIAGVSKKTGRRTERVGTGGQFLQVFCHEPTTVQSARHNGRTLVRSLPDKITGILIQHDDEEHRLELGSEFFEALRELANSVELEDALLASGPIDSTKLRRAMWSVPVLNNDHLWSTSAVSSGHVATASTNQDCQAFDYECAVKSMSGEALFTRVISEPSYDGLGINAGISFGRNGKAVQNMLLAPGLLHRALTRDRFYLRMNEPIARSREEFELWLELNDFPAQRDIHETTNAKGENLLVAVSKKPSEHWRQQETDGLQDLQIVKSQTFVVKPEPAVESQFGQGPSLILCPGQLARALYTPPPKGKKTQHNWHPGKSILLARVLSDEDIQKSSHRLLLANELLKLLPAAASQIARTSILTVGGANFLRLVPYAATREWIEGTIEQAKQNCSKLVTG